MKKGERATVKKSYLLIVQKNPQQRAVGSQVNGMDGMVVRDVVVNLSNVDGGTRCHHQKNQDHDGDARHFEVRKIFTMFWDTKKHNGIFVLREEDS